MSVQLTEKAARLLKWETKAFAHLALALKDGTPQVTPVWFDFDGTHIVINSARGRVKDRVLSRQPVVALAISDPDDPYSYIQVRGQVETVTEVGGREMIDRLSMKYHGRPYQNYRGETRVTYRIRIDKISP